ncbi:MAG: hypothetical protein VXX55_01910, partial [Planctomycetota bacterium]|nr:hypothetical protein [Planctomycetota bacterium]
MIAARGSSWIHPSRDTDFLKTLTDLVSADYRVQENHPLSRLSTEVAAQKSQIVLGAQSWKEP